MTQLSNVLITDNSTYYQNKLAVNKTSDNCVFSRADLRAIKLGIKELLNIKEQIGNSEPFPVTNLPVYLQM